MTYSSVSHNIIRKPFTARDSIQDAVLYDSPTLAILANAVGNNRYERLLVSTRTGNRSVPISARSELRRCIVLQRKPSLSQHRPPFAELSRYLIIYHYLGPALLRIVLQEIV